MSCASFESLSAYADGQSPLPEAERIAAHLPGCERCRMRLKSISAVSLSLAELPAPDMPSDLQRDLLEMGQKRPVQSVPWGAAFSFAAACLVLLMWSQRRPPMDLLLAAHSQHALTRNVETAENLLWDMSSQPELFVNPPSECLLQSARSITYRGRNIVHYRCWDGDRALSVFLSPGLVQVL